MSRLPNANEARRILTAARQPTASDAQKKAKNNLLKSVKWAFDALNRDDQREVRVQFATAMPQVKMSLDSILDKANRGDVDLEEAVALVEAVRTAKSGLQFTMDKLIPTNAAQLQVFGVPLASFKTYLDEINNDQHDAILDRVFLNPSWVPGSQWLTRRHVKKTFQLAYDVVNGWYNHPQNRFTKIQIDTSLDSQKAGGLSKPGGLELPESFYDARSTKYTPNYRVSVLVHESTHAIQDASHRTDDAGGYIGSGSFQTATLEVRLKNASHYQYVFERILNMPEAQPPPIATDQNVIEAKQIVKNAWIYAVNCYTRVHRYSTQPGERVKPAEQEAVREIGKLFGLSVGKDGGPVPDVSVGDVAAMENRVGKLGVLLGYVERAAELVDVNVRTRDNILEKLVEEGGMFPEGMMIRKPSDPAKTIAMMKVAAMNCHQVQDKTTTQVRQQAMQDFTNKQFGAIPQVNY